MVCVCLDSCFAIIPPVLAGVLVCLCSCAGCACTPPIRTAFCGVRVWVQILAAPCQTQLQFVVLSSGYGFGFNPANPCWVV